MASEGPAVPSSADPFLPGRLRLLVLLALLAAVALFWRFNVPRFDPNAIRLPPGFHLGVFAEGLPGARGMAIGEDGTVFISSLDRGTVHALRDEDGDGVAEARSLVAGGLDHPHGVAMRRGALYVAERHRLLRFDSVESRWASPQAPSVVLDSLPGEDLHGAKYLRKGPDGWLYLSIGAPCNVCRVDDPRVAAIVRIEPELGRIEPYALGVRNSLGFDWQPGGGVLWFTDNWRDWLGDDRPPDELNRAPQPGLQFGFPDCFGDSVADPEYGRRACREFTGPAAELAAHVAPLGMRFYDGVQFPEAYWGHVFIAEHGSWNRSEPIGYRISRVRVDGDRVLGYEVFAEGWLRGRWAWGRPVDVQVATDGALLVSDDRAGAIYRITWSPSD